MRTALLAGEHGVICLDLAEMLRELRFTVQTCSVAEYTVLGSLLCGEPPSLAVVETTIPSRSLLHAIGTALTMRWAPIVAISTLPPTQLLRDLPSGLIVCLEKPFSPRQLAAAVAEVTAARVKLAFLLLPPFGSARGVPLHGSVLPKETQKGEKMIYSEVVPSP